LVVNQKEADHGGQRVGEGMREVREWVGFVGADPPVCSNSESVLRPFIEVEES
jgi:hypothetical protein